MDLYEMGFFEQDGEGDPYIARLEDRLFALVAAIEIHRAQRYGDPPKGPFYVTDTDLYKRAKIQ